MADLVLPAGIPPVYRGGPSLTLKPHEVKLNRKTGLLKTTHGVSVDAMPEHVARFGGAYLVRGAPPLLTIVQRGQRDAHYEIVPAIPMTPAQYQTLLDQVELELFQKES